MKVFSILILFFLVNHGYGQVVLDADGPGNTYELITSVLAPGYNPIEVPDCNHPEFGEHIDELYDDDLGMNVFRFHIHVSSDDDRCINFDRQRNEIKSYNQSPDNLLGVENEKVVYKWKFKLAAGFQSSPNFTHLHQLKSVGGSFAGLPMYTLTTRKGNPDRLELRYTETDAQVTLSQTDLAPFIGTWLDVTETITYGSNGSYEIIIKRLSDNEILFNYSNNSIVNWQPGASFVRPKWGIYRSLINEQDLRDEEVLYANFSIEELNLVSSENISDESIVINQFGKRLDIKNIPKEVSSIKIYSIDGKQIMSQNIDSTPALDIDLSSYIGGVYILNFSGEQINQTKLFLIYQ